MEMKKFEDILKSISSDVLTEEVKTAIAATFNEAVDAKVKSQAQLIVENELAKMDDDHTVKMQKLVEAIDEDHTKKFKAIIEKIDAAHTKKLQLIIEKHEKDLKDGATGLRNELVGKISTYLDLYLKESIPDTQLKEAVENIRARKMVNEIKKIVAVDPEFISENFKEALKDGHDTIEKLRGELNAKIKESIDINQKLIQTKTALLMEQKTKDLPEEKKQFVAKILDGKKPEEIEANFKFVLEMFDKEEAEKVEAATTDATAQSKTVKAKIETPKSVIQETVQNEGTNVDSRVASYLAEMDKI